MQSQTDLAKVLVATLDQETLTSVLAQLLGRPETPPPPPPDRPFRSRDFRIALGNLSPSAWHQMRERGLIPPGTKISPHVEIWAREQVVSTIANLAALQRERERGT
jgi:hypothetical protein